MRDQNTNDGVMLPAGYTGSGFFHHILAEATTKFPKVFSSYSLPNTKKFKGQYGEAVVQFEAMRASSEQRSEIAKYIVSRTHNQLMFKNQGDAIKFKDYMADTCQPAPMKKFSLSGQKGLKPAIPFRKQIYQANSFKSLSDLLLKEHKITKSAAKALNWIEKYCEQHDGMIDLRGQKFVIMGASAELAPTKLLLAAGASVLWIDIQSPESILSDHCLGGELTFAEEASNILLQPKKIKTTIEAFSEGDPLHIGMFAYAAGASQEWRLTATMNGIIRNLNPEIVKSVSMFISPTSAAVIQKEDLHTAKKLNQQPPAWQKLLKNIGQLQQQISFEWQGTSVARGIVPLQGVSYQAAQYVSKTLAAEVFATHGLNLTSTVPKPIAISANVAGITKTRSLRHPVFQAAFRGATSFGVEIFEVPTTRALSGILILHDILNPVAAERKTHELFSNQVHGGIYTRPYALDPMIRIATIMGLAQQPKLLLKML